MKHVYTCNVYSAYVHALVNGPLLLFLVFSFLFFLVRTYVGLILLFYFLLLWLRFILIVIIMRRRKLLDFDSPDSVFTVAIIAWYNLFHVNLQLPIPHDLGT